MLMGILLKVAVLERCSLFSDGVIGEEGVGEEHDKCDRVMNVVDKSSTTRVTRKRCSLGRSLLVGFRLI